MAEEERKEVVEVVEEEIVIPEHKWTFLKYLKSIAHFKWWVIGFSLGGLVAGFLGFKFILNPMQKQLSATFTYDLAGTYEEGDTDTLRFIDGTTFNSYDLTSRVNLQKVKESKEIYSGINVDKLVSNNSISLTKNVVYYNENDSESANVTFVISSKANVFPTDDIGKEFLFDLIYLPKTLSEIAVNNYNAISYFTDNFDSLIFERQISQLEKQYNLNFSVYTSLSTTFGSSAVGNSDGNKIYDLQNKYISKYYTSSSQSFIQELTSFKDVNKYVNYTIGKEGEKIAEIHEQCAAYINSIELEQEQLVVYEKALDTLVSSASVIGTDTNVSAQISKLTDDITELKLEINTFQKALNNSGYFLDNDPASPTYGKYVFDELYEDSIVYKLVTKEESWVNGCIAFKKKINDYKESLEADRQTATSVYSYCYGNYKNRVNVQGGGYVKLSGGISEFIGAAAGFVAFFALSSLIVAAIYVYKNKEE